MDKKLSEDVGLSKYAIGSNGAFVYNYEDDINIFESVMKTENLERIWRICEKENLELTLEAKRQNYGNPIGRGKRAYPQKYTEINKIEDIGNDKIFQMVIDVYTEQNEEQKINEILLKEKQMWIANHGIGSKGIFLI